MPFKNTDLAVSVLPHLAFDPAKIAQFCALRTWICHWPTFCGVSCPKVISYCGRCSLLMTEITGGGCHILHSCGPGGSACDPTFVPGCVAGSEPFVIQHAEDLVTLRAELTRTLQQLDDLAKEGLPSAITSRAQADQLEQQLKQQLDMVRKAKESLK
jgi:hypothetical protein